MTSVLSQIEIDNYHRDGFLSPLRVLSSSKVEGYLKKYRTFYLRHNPNFDAKSVLRSKPHLVFPWLYDLVTSPTITDHVSKILGPNLLAWGSSFFAKQAHDAGFVSWHQDANYWGLEPHNVLTAWVAFSPSKASNGCMRVIPGSQLGASLDHQDTFSKDNLLTRGQEIIADLDENKAIDLELEPGEMSLHHVNIVHGSERNESNVDRIGFAIRYISTEVKQTAGKTSATLARGIDHFGNFDHEPRPTRSFNKESQNVRNEALKRQHDVLYNGAKQR